MADFVQLLVERGADEAVTIAAVDHLSDLFAHIKRKLWETAARRDPVLACLGLSPDQCGALVAQLAGSRRELAADQADSLLVVGRAAHAQCVPVELSVAQLRRARVYTCFTRLDGTPAATTTIASRRSLRRTDLECW